MSKYVMMPKALSRADSEALFHSYGISDLEATYKDMGKVLSRPLPGIHIKEISGQVTDTVLEWLQRGLVP